MDFALELAFDHLRSLSKWGLQRVVDGGRNGAAVLLRKSDHEILRQVVKRLEKSSERMQLMLTNQALAPLCASFAHVRVGLTIILV